MEGYGCARQIVFTDSLGGWSQGYILHTEKGAIT
jgi:hypothetical protein